MHNIIIFAKGVCLKQVVFTNIDSVMISFYRDTQSEEVKKNKR